MSDINTQLENLLALAKEQDVPNNLPTLTKEGNQYRVSYGKILGKLYSSPEEWIRKNQSMFPKFTKDDFSAASVLK